MKTKGDILEENGSWFHSDEVYKSMDSYAEQMAIGFAEWIDEQGFWLDTGLWHCDAYLRTAVDSKVLYQLYLKSLEK